MAQGAIFWGWALAVQGQGEEGIAQLREGMSTCRATGAEFTWPFYLALLAEAYGKVGQIEEGLSALTEAVITMDKTGEGWYEAELYRLKGQLTLQQQCKEQSAKCKVPST
jgi:predicted ATPase